MKMVERCSGTLGFVVGGGRCDVLRREGRYQQRDVCGWTRGVAGVGRLSVGVNPRKVGLRSRRRESVVRCSIAGPLVQAGSTMAGLAVLALTILVHETGHYLAARSRGIRVQNFSIGFGPKLIGFKPRGSETEFTLRAIPLGGYVSFPNPTKVDEETGEEIELKDPDLLPNRPVADRALVISAGVIANVILAWSSLFFSVTAFGLPSVQFQPGVLVSQLVDEAGNGAKAGIQKGDIILAIDGDKVSADGKAAANVAHTIRSSKGRTLRFELQRGNDILNMKVCT